MRDERISEVLAYIAKVLREDFGATPSRLTEYESSRRNFVRGRSGYSHVLWMCEEAQKYMAAGRVKKACRWLGFIQCFLWCNHIFSVTELKNMSRDRPPHAPVFKVGDVVQFKRSPGVRHRIVVVRPTGYTSVEDFGEPSGTLREWDTEATADPFYASGEWELAPERALTAPNLWPDLELRSEQAKPACPSFKSAVVTDTESEVY